MKFNLRELEYFVAVADHRHFGKASEQVKVSQPTLSMQLKKMERSLRGKLFERSPRNVLLTSLGTELLPLARELLRLASEIESRCGTQEKPAQLRLGVIPTISPYLLPKINRGLSKIIHGGKVSLIEAQTADLVRFVREGSIDLALLSTPLRERGLREIPIYSEPFYMAVDDAHPLAGMSEVGLKDLKEENLLLLSEGHCLRNQALSLCKLSHTQGDTDFSATSIETLRSMVAMGGGITLIPKLAVRRGEGVSYIPFSERVMSRTVGIVCRHSYQEEASIDALVSLIRDVAQKERMRVL